MNSFIVSNLCLVISFDLCDGFIKEICYDTKDLRFIFSLFCVLLLAFFSTAICFRAHLNTTRFSILRFNRSRIRNRGERSGSSLLHFTLFFYIFVSENLLVEFGSKNHRSRNVRKTPYFPKTQIQNPNLHAVPLLLLSTRHPVHLIFLRPDLRFLPEPVGPAGDFLHCLA